MSLKTILPPFSGGEEKTYEFTLLESENVNGPYIPNDLTDHKIVAEIWWADCKRITLTVDNGIEILNLAPPPPPPGGSVEPQFLIRLTENQTNKIPVGKGGAYIKIIDEPPNGITEITGPFYLERML